MDDNQREAMYNGWKNSKTILEVITCVDPGEKATCSVTYKGKVYSETCYQENMIGSANPLNIAFNMLCSKMKNIDNSIELKYPI